MAGADSSSDARPHAAVVRVLAEATAPLGFLHGEMWRPRFTPNGSAVLELACTSFEELPAEARAGEPLRHFVESSATIKFAQGYGLPGRVWASAQPEWTHDVRVVPPQNFMRGEIAVTHGFLSALGIPIAPEGTAELCAVAVFFSGSHDEPSVEIMSALGAVMRRLARAVAALPDLPTASPIPLNRLGVPHTLPAGDED
ncbi:hypothetical protein KFE25_010416 [Diacronema lutheri]|uniref:GAF domain-containing protein n=1 Tax=Diacronema lutheri TaxID=2081491 RepID=A0A8J6C950_DIALT|nr:hypothetical protein KFE25_010416 [Diacronema lutheri]